MGKGIIMDEYFESLVERTQYYEHFEFFRDDRAKVQVGFDSNEQQPREVIVVELILKHNQGKND